MTPRRNPAERAAQAARQALESVGRGRRHERREFTISKFGRHEDGYLHARVIVEGQAFYLHRKFGSWLAPGHIGQRMVLKEPEALLGNQLGSEVKYALSEKSAPIDAADRKAREEKKNAHEQTARAPEDAGGGSSPAGADRLPAGGDSGDTGGAVEPEQDPGEPSAGPRDRTPAIG